jgi:hypothetical protein
MYILMFTVLDYHICISLVMEVYDS